MTEQEVEIYEAEHQPQLEKLYLELYGTCNDSQDERMNEE